MKKNLFADDSHESWTNESITMASNVRKALEPIIQQAVLDGYKMRDVAYVMHSEVDSLTLRIMMEPK